MLPVSAAELAAIQSEAQAACCDKTCQIYRKASLTSDGYGSDTSTLTLHATTVAGMRQPTAGELANYDFMIADKAAWTVHLPIGTDVQHQDQLLIEGQYLEVHVILTPKSYPALLDVIAAELK